MHAVLNVSSEMKGSINENCRSVSGQFLEVNGRIQSVSNNVAEVVAELQAKKQEVFIIVEAM